MIFDCTKLLPVNTRTGQLLQDIRNHGSINRDIRYHSAALPNDKYTEVNNYVLFGISIAFGT